MKKCILALILLTYSASMNAQVSVAEGGLFSGVYSKEITQYMIKEYIVEEILKVEAGEMIEVKIYAISASVSGELTTVIYECEKLNKSGLILAFWSERKNAFNTDYKGFSFRNIDKVNCKDFFEKIEMVIESKKDYLRKDNDYQTNNVIYKWEDITFIFYTTITSSNPIRVLWNDYDSEWSKQNFKATKDQFDKFFNSPKK